MPQYETIVVVPPELGKTATKDVENKLNGVIKKFDGKMSLVEDWGTRRVTRPIKKSGKAHYVYLNYSAKPKSQAEITRVFNIDENIWRFASVKLEEGYDYTKAKASFLPENSDDYKGRRGGGGGGGRRNFRN